MRCALVLEAKGFPDVNVPRRREREVRRELAAPLVKRELQRLVERLAFAGRDRGLDRLRQSGWRGSGYVRWRYETNRGFLRALDGLRASAEAIGELDEAQRCAEFLSQLDPGGIPPGE